MRGRGKIRVLRTSLSVRGQLVGAGTSNPSLEAGFGPKPDTGRTREVSHSAADEALIGICLCDLHSVGLKTVVAVVRQKGTE